MISECVYRSKSPLGPFEAPPDGVNPVIFNDDHPDIQNTGHMDLIEGDDGKWIAVFLGVRPVFEAREISGGTMGMPTHLGRESFMAPVQWVDGWPVVNNRKPIELIGEAEGLTLTPEVTSSVDNFDQKGKRLCPGSVLTTRSRHRLVSSSGTSTRLSQPHRKAWVPGPTRWSTQHRCRALAFYTAEEADPLRSRVVDRSIVRSFTDWRRSWYRVMAKFDRLRCYRGQKERGWKASYCLPST